MTAIALAAAIAVPAITAVGPATAGTTLKMQTKSAPMSTRMAKVKRRAGRATPVSGSTGGSGYPNNNIASAWTAACYAEFGPDAIYPDAAMLDMCLNWGS